MLCQVVIVNGVVIEGFFLSLVLIFDFVGVFFVKFDGKIKIFLLDQVSDL